MQCVLGCKSAGAWRGGGGAEMLLLFWQLVASINFSPLTKIHQAAVLAHRFCLSRWRVEGGGWRGHQEACCLRFGVAGSIDQEAGHRLDGVSTCGLLGSLV